MGQSQSTRHLPSTRSFRRSKSNVGLQRNNNVTTANETREDDHSSLAEVVDIDDIQLDNFDVDGNGAALDESTPAVSVEQGTTELVSEQPVGCVESQLVAVEETKNVALNSPSKVADGADAREVGTQAAASSEAGSNTTSATPAAGSKTPETDPSTHPAKPVLDETSSKSQNVEGAVVPTETTETAQQTTETDTDPPSKPIKNETAETPTSDSERSPPQTPRKTVHNDTLDDESGEHHKQDSNGGTVSDDDGFDASNNQDAEQVTQDRTPEKRNPIAVSSPRSTPSSGSGFRTPTQSGPALRKPSFSGNTLPDKAARLLGANPEQCEQIVLEVEQLALQKSLPNKAVRILGEEQCGEIALAEARPIVEGVERFKILELLGEGRQGVVHKVEDVNTGWMYAMKKIPGASFSKRHRLSLTPGQNMQSEIGLMRKIRHRNIVQLCDVIDSPTDNALCLILEYVPGGCIKQLSDRQLLAGTGIPLEEETARSYFRQLLAALDYLFCHGIIHRDIKPSNLLVNEETGQLKLADFGIAIPTQSSKAAKILGSDDDIFAGGGGGTPAFLSPEYYRIVFGTGEEDELTDTESEVEVDEDGNEILSKAVPMSVPQSYHGRDADIWAAGMTLFAFMYGSLPFISNSSSFQQREDPATLSMEVIADRVLNCPLKFPGTGLGTSQKMRSLLSKLLDKNPVSRIGLHELFKDPWVCKHEPMPRLTDNEKTPFFGNERRDANSDEVPILFHIKRVGRKLRSQAHILHHKARASLHSHRSNSLQASDLDYMDDDFIGE